MNKDLKINAFAKTPVPKSSWSKIKEQDRISLIKNELNKMNKDINNIVQIILASKNGQVVVRLLKNLSPAERGNFLLDIEFLLKKKLDDAIFINVEPMGDKSSLRNLRGLTIKSE
tara:strand:- start:85 stop:429 length:345 start_codon:yes stop_codon:yes gene_type:complete